MLLSIIIPTLNEEKYLGNLLHFLRKQTDPLNTEIIVIDGGSSDNTKVIAHNYGAVILSTNASCRAVQMNMGVKNAKGEILYFVHADVLPPERFSLDIMNAFAEGKKIGMYRQKFDGGPIILKINSYFTRFNWLWCRGGDQTLFVCKKLFDSLNGFDESFVIMEEYDFISRSVKKEKLYIFDKYTTVSARKYSTNGYLKVLFANRKAFSLYLAGYDPKIIKKTYLSMLNPY
ncbi:MAG: TIGR04283 family arsenosugar biosynthesis glycosyltransferase [Saprospiraceae bacterium]